MTDEKPGGTQKFRVDPLEIRRMNSYEHAKRLIAAVSGAKEEMIRQGKRPNITQVLQEIGYAANSNTTPYYAALRHVYAVEVLNISPLLSREEALKRLVALDPAMFKIWRLAREVQDTRADGEIMTDAFVNLTKMIRDTIGPLDYKVVSGFVTRYPGKAAEVKPVISELLRWMVALERTL